MDNYDYYEEHALTEKLSISIFYSSESPLPSRGHMRKREAILCYNFHFAFLKKKIKIHVNYTFHPQV